MSDPQNQEYEANLTLRDRINHPYLVANQILSYQNIIQNPELAEDVREKAIIGLKNIIPEAWYDNTFNAEMKKAKITEEIDVRPLWCGRRLSVDFCEKNKYPIMEEIKTWDTDKVLHACINLLYRLGVLTRKSFTEKFTGRKAKKKVVTIDETNVTEL